MTHRASYTGGRSRPYSTRCSIPSPRALTHARTLGSVFVVQATAPNGRVAVILASSGKQLSLKPGNLRPMVYTPKGGPPTFVNEAGDVLSPQDMRALMHQGNKNGPHPSWVEGVPCGRVRKKNQAALCSCQERRREPHDDDAGQECKPHRARLGQRRQHTAPCGGGAQLAGRPVKLRCSCPQWAGKSSRKQRCVLGCRVCANHDRFSLAPTFCLFSHG